MDFGKRNRPEFKYNHTDSIELTEMKHFFKFFGMMVLTLAICAGFASCSKDDDEPEDERWKATVNHPYYNRLVNTSWKLSKSTGKSIKTGNIRNLMDQDIWSAEWQKYGNTIITFKEYNSSEFKGICPLKLSCFNNWGTWYFNEDGTLRWDTSYQYNGNRDKISVEDLVFFKFVFGLGFDVEIKSLTSTKLVIEYNDSSEIRSHEYTRVYSEEGDDDDDNEENNNGGNGGGTTNHHYPCKSCDESGDCWNCFGSGTDPITNRKCTLCHGSGKCQICFGRGYIIV